MTEVASEGRGHRFESCRARFLNARENIEVVRRFVRAVNEGEDDLSGICQADFVLTESKTLPGAATVSGLDELRSYARGWERNWSEWEWREEEIEEVAWEELMPECLWKFRVKDFGPLTVGIDAHGNSLYRDVQARARAKLEELYARL